MERETITSELNQDTARPMSLSLILDSTVLISDFALSGRPLQSVLRMGRKNKMRILVPTLVLDEAVNKFALECHSYVNKLKKDGTKFGLPVGLLDIDADQLCEQYQIRLREVLKDANIELRPLPTIDNESLARRAINRQKPFREDGKGYRDALIWETVKDVCRETTEGHVVFVSGNSRDFGVGGLALELVTDLSECGLAQNLVTLELSLKAVAEKYVPAHEHILERFNENILGSVSSLLQLAERMCDAFDSPLGTDDLEDALIGSGISRLDVRDIRLVGLSITQPPEVTAESAYQISDNQTGIEAELAVSAEIEIDISGVRSAPMEVLIDRPWEMPIYDHMLHRRVSAMMVCEVVVDENLKIESVSDGSLVIVPTLSYD